MLIRTVFHQTPLLFTSKLYIRQNSKRLRTHQVPQQNIIPEIPQEIFDQELLLTLVRIKSAFEKLKQLQPLQKQSKQIGNAKKMTNVIQNQVKQPVKEIQVTVKPGIGQIKFEKLKLLEIESSYGYFIFEGERQLSTLFYTSPFSGVYKYYFDLKSKQWKSNKDEHIFQENLARQIQGKLYAYLQI